MLTGSYVAIVTPFTKDNKIDEKALFDLVSWQVENGSDGIVCCGTTGESPTLSDDEKFQVISICKEAIDRKVPLIVGSGGNSTKKTIDFTNKVCDLGVDICLVIVPYYNKPTQEGCYLHFKEVAKTKAKIIVYHHPGRTGVTLTPTTFARLSEIENIIAIKEASGNLSLAKEIIKNSSVPVLSGDDMLTLYMIKNGATGVISVVANCFPSLMKQLVSLSLNKQYPQAQNLLNKLQPLCEAMIYETNPQCVKHALHLMNKCTNFLRLPLTVPSQKNQQKIKEILENYFNFF